MNQKNSDFLELLSTITGIHDLWGKRYSLPAGHLWINNNNPVPQQGPHVF